jgi:integrase
MELERKILDGLLEIGGCVRSEGNAPPETILQASEEFLNYLVTEERRSKTLQKYRGILTNFASFAELRKVARLADVNMRLIDQFRAHRKPHIGRKSMHHEGVLLKGFLEWCRQRKLISENPLRDTKFKRPSPPRRGGPDLEQIDSILRLADDRRRPILAMLAFTGMRSGECRHLQTSDVDLRGNWIKIESRDGYETKTGESRKVPIHPRLRTYLKGLTRRKRQWFFTSPATPKYPNGDHYLNTKKLNEYFLELLRKLDIPAGRKCGFTLHSLRHSFKTICINAGIPREVVDAWQGHSPDRSAGSAYYRLSGAVSQRFMKEVPFGTGESAADADDKESRR